jgi:Zn-dependent protease with chaperone function
VPGFVRVEGFLPAGTIYENRWVTSLFIVPVLLLLGAFVAWFDGRHLIPERRSPAFPERWWGYLARQVGVGGLLVAAMLFGISTHMWSLGLALTACALLVAHYPVRRAAYGETWGLVRYVATTLRRAAAFFGFWILLAVTPQLILASPDHRWLAASILAALLLGGLRYRREVVLFLVRATPLVHTPEGFDRVLAHADIAVPVTVYRAGVTGGLWADSFALPSPSDHVVVIGDSLIETLDPDALTAIFAHEVAHLERWTGRRTSRVAALATGLVAVAIGGGLGLLQLRVEIATLVAAMWGGGLVLALAIWMVGRCGDERVGDLRAAALCEDASALVRALLVVHALRRIPRRLSPFGEETSTHPSLARRLQAIRQAAGIAPATLASPVVLSSPDLDRVVIIDAERAHWLGGVAAGVARDPEAVRLSAHSARSLPYRQLTDLRLVTSVSGATWLKATHRSGRAWRTPIRTQDVAAAQAALDVVDERLSAEPAVTRRRATLLVLFAATAAASAWAHVGVSPIIVLAAIVIARPRQSPGWMTGVLILLWAFQHGVGPRTAIPFLVMTLTGACMVVGAMAFVIGPALRRRAALRPAPGETIVVAGALVAFALILGVDVLWVSRSAAASIPHWRVDAVGLSLLTVAVVVALGRWRRRWMAAVASGALGVAIFRWGPAAVAAWAPLASGTPLAVHDAPAPRSQVVTLDPSARQLLLSPSASQFAVQVGRSQANMPYDVVLGRFDGGQRQLSAYDLAIVDETLALLVGRTTAGLELRTLPLDPSGALDPPGWSVALPAVYEPRVAADASSRTWTVVGWHPEQGDAISVAGRIDEDAREVRRWIIPGADANANFFYLPVIDTALAVTRASLVHGPALLSRLAGVPEHRWQLWKLDGKTGATLAVTAAALVCLDPLPRDHGLLCLARHAAHTVIWSVDGRSGKITELGTIGAFRLARLKPGHVRLVMVDGTILHVPRGGRQTTRFAPAAEPGDIVDLDSTEDHVAMLVRGRTEVRLSLHETR